MEFTPMKCGIFGVCRILFTIQGKGATVELLYFSKFSMLKLYSISLQLPARRVMYFRLTFN